MNLVFEPFDGRGLNCRTVIDKDTGAEVGRIMSYGVGPHRSGGIHVSLFGGKYDRYFRRYDQCVGFVKGVEAVLDHMTATGEQTAQAAA